jgi:Flp pilus assembly pilin Flp
MIRASPNVPRRKATRRRGQTLIEYALILAFLSVVVISVLSSLGSQVRTTFSRITTSLSSAAGSH